MAILPAAPRPIHSFTPGWRAHARQRYEETEESRASIAVDLRIHRCTLDKITRMEGWALRKDRVVRDLPELWLL